MSALDRQVGGDHYRKGKIQPIEYIHSNRLGYIEGAIVKYITRWREKGGREDLEKIKHYVDLLIELEKLDGDKDANATPQQVVQHPQTLEDIRKEFEKARNIPVPHPMEIKYGPAASNSPPAEGQSNG